MLAAAPRYCVVPHGLCVDAMLTTRPRRPDSSNASNPGKVCLSLLGTWEGPGWVPDTSTLSQVRAQPLDDDDWSLLKHRTCL